MKVFEFLSHRYNITIQSPGYDPEKERQLELEEKASFPLSPLTADSGVEKVLSGWTKVEQGTDSA
eukprot:scaffold20320_cov51-Prasinocladus_malaysianus.AAC.3